MEYPIKLPPLAEIKAKALDAMNDAELQCQQVEFRRNSGCKYAGPCAIGAGLPEDIRVLLDGEYESAPVDELIADGVLSPHDENDVEALREIQSAHDFQNIDRLRALLTA